MDWRRQGIIWTNADPVHRRIYAPLGGDEFKKAPFFRDGRVQEAPKTTNFCSEHCNDVNTSVKSCL